MFNSNINCNVNSNISNISIIKNISIENKRTGKVCLGMLKNNSNCYGLTGGGYSSNSLLTNVKLNQVSDYYKMVNSAIF
jgi:hypothetical protein